MVGSGHIRLHHSSRGPKTGRQPQISLAWASIERETDRFFLFLLPARIYFGNNRYHLTGYRQGNKGLVYRLPIHPTKDDGIA